MWLHGENTHARTFSKKFHNENYATITCSSNLVMFHFGKLEMSHLSEFDFDDVRFVDGTVCNEREQA